MSEHKKINIEALRWLLRYGRKISGPWDEVDMADDEWMADDGDADLLAAAPDLLAACEAMLTQIGRPGMAEARQKALDAVAKARGERRCEDN
jgi:hypothetical protein